MENKEVFRRFYEAAWNAGDARAAEGFLDESFVNHELADTGESHRALYRRAVEETYAAFPDWSTEVEDLLAEGEKVAARWRSTGTHSGVLPGRPPTGARVQVRGITVVRVSGGRITDFWKSDDSHDAQRQLEGAPEPGR